jgi:hypothetical protein
MTNPRFVVVGATTAYNLLINLRTRIISMADKKGEPSQFSSLIDFAGTGMAGYVEASQKMLSGMAELNEEVFKFLARRVEADLAASKAVTSCRDWEQIRDVQTNYLSTAATDYMDEGRKIMEITTRITQKAWTPPGN